MNIKNTLDESDMMNKRINNIFDNKESSFTGLPFANC